MAKVYTGNMEAADKGLLDALRRLGDSYHVFVEFQIPNPRGQRQVDFLVIRADNVKPCIFMLEVKNERRRLRGTINGPWEFEDGPGYWRTLPVSNPRDQNPIQQAYNTARTMQAWLSSMRTLIQDPEDPWPDVPTVFPRLVLPVAHPDNQLQTDSFTWRFDGYDRTIDSLLNFIPRDPVPLSVGEIERLAQHLGVQREPDSVAPPVEVPTDNRWLRAAIDELLSEVAALRREVRELRATGGRTGLTSYPPRTNGVLGRQAEPPRDIELAFRTLTDVIRDLKASGRKLVFPNVQEGLWRRLGEFNVEDYGFFKFKEFLQEAERRGIVILRIIDGVDYVSLPGDEPQIAASNGPSSLDDLVPDERNRFIESIAELESRSAYMIRSYIARHLTAAAVLPLPMYEVRALVNDAVNRGLFGRGTRPFRHPATGEMQSLETLTLDLTHPWVEEALRIVRDANGDSPRVVAEDVPSAEDAHEEWASGDWEAIPVDVAPDGPFSAALPQPHQLADTYANVGADYYSEGDNDANAMREVASSDAYGARDAEDELELHRSGSSDGGYWNGHNRGDTQRNYAPHQNGTADSEEVADRE